MRAVGMIGVATVLALGGCTTSVLDFESFKAPDASIFRPRSVATMQSPVLKPVTAEDLVDGEGRCAGAVATSDVAPDGSVVAVTPTLSGIGLEMTECEVVRRAGQPERIQVGTNERNERTLTLTYLRGERPGVYLFTSGRLVSMERSPEPPAPPKPQRAKPKAKAKPRTANVN